MKKTYEEMSKKEFAKLRDERKKQRQKEIENVLRKGNELCYSIEDRLEKEHIHRENRAGKERDSIAGGITRVIGGVEDVGKGMESLIKKIDEGGK